MTTLNNNNQIVKEYKYTRNGKDIIIRRKYTNKLPDKNRYDAEFDTIRGQLMTAKTYALKRSIYNKHYRPISITCFYRHYNQWINNQSTQSTDQSPTSSIDDQK